MKSSKDQQLTIPAILIVGDPGTRKTTLAMHAPSPYFFDMDHNLSAPARQVKKDFLYDQGATDDHNQVIPEASRYAHLSKCIKEAVMDPSVKTIILDSFTTLTDILIAEIRRQDPKVASPMIPLRIQDWGKFAYLFKELIMRIRHTDKLLICIAHQKIEKDEADGSYKTFLNIPGANANYISGLFTDVWGPFPHITGMGGGQKHEWRVRTLPTSSNDHRGMKSSFGFKVTESFDKVAKELSDFKFPEPAPLPPAPVEDSEPSISSRPLTFKERQQLTTKK